MSSPAPGPIGVFDSGVGGLTVVAALRQHLPNEPILYLGDTARLPYGTKSPATVARYTQRAVDFLVRQRVKAIVIACNSASAMALSSVSAPVPTWGVLEPGAERAAALTRGRVGVIATDSTIRTGAYRDALLRRRPELYVASQACPLFVPLVEEGWIDDPVTRQVATRYLEPLLSARVDTLLLGCTHYPLLAPLLAELSGDDVTLVDSADAISQTVRAAIASGELTAAPAGNAPRHHIYVTDNGPRFERLARDIMGDDAALEWLEQL